jgi:predicted ATPase
MKLRKLTISAFKNLRDFRVDFGPDLTTVLLGQNGTGKSNLLEALIIIFRDLDLGEITDFAYTLEYECRNNLISINSDPARDATRKNKQVFITVRKGEELPRSIPYTQFRDAERTYLPSYVFGYYSGPSNRMEKHFDKHQDRFYRDLLKGADKPLRPLLYARPVHSQFALLAFFIDEDEQLAEGEQSIRDFLDELLGIRELDSVLFIMRQPPWTSKEGDERFWNARGVVGNLLAYLYDIALMPMRLNVRVTPEFARKQTLEHLYLYLPNIAALKKLYQHYGNQQEFFKALESTYISKILSEVRIKIRRRSANGSLTFSDLSEGEQQLLMVLGLLRFTREEEALFLLDEPDTHLNPTWSIQYLEFMRQIVGDQPTSHVIMSTHNPLVIAGLQQKDVRVMQRDNTDGVVSANIPHEDPQGMGVAGILTSELFGLRSTLDKPTQDKLDRRRELAFKDDHELNQREEQELNRLNAALSNLDFTITPRDPLYQSFASEYREFVKDFVRQAEPDLTSGIVFTPEQRERQRELTRSILRKIKRQRGQQA